MDISGYLNTRGPAVFRDISTNNIDVSGKANFTDISARNVDISGYLNTRGPAVFRDISTNNIDVSGKANFTDISARNVDISGYLSVAGKTTLKDISANGNADISGCLTVKCLTVTGESKLYDVSVNNNIQFYGKVIADNSSGSINQVLTSTGTGVVWANPSGGSGGTSSLVDVSDVDISNNLYYYTFVDGSGQQQVNINSNSGLYYLNRFIGVNNSNPTRTLDISGDIAISRGLYAQNTAGALNQFLMSTGSSVTWSSSLKNVDISANNTDISGYLSVNSYSKLRDVSVNGNVDISGCLRANCLTISGPSNFLDVSLGGKVYAGGTSGTNTQVLTSTGAGVIWATAGGGGGSASFVDISDISANDGNVYHYTFVDSSGIQKVFISSATGLFYKNTNVGINNNNPTKSLDISGNARVYGTVDVSDIRIDNRLYANNSSGTNGQILTSTGSGVVWSSNLYGIDISARNMDISGYLNTVGPAAFRDISTNNIDVSGRANFTDISARNVDISGYLNTVGPAGFRDISTNNIDVSGRANFTDISARNVDISGYLNTVGPAGFRDISTNNIDVSGRANFTDISARNVDISGYLEVRGATRLQDVSGYGNVDISGCLTVNCLTVNGPSNFQDVSFGARVYAGGVSGSGGQVLTSTGSGVEWSSSIVSTFVDISDISANGDGNVYYYTFVDGSGQQRIYISSGSGIYYRNTNVGINTSLPTKPVDISGDTRIYGTLDASDVKIDNRLYANNSSGTNGQVLTSTGTGLSWSSNLSVQNIDASTGFIRDLSSNNLDVSNNFTVHGDTSLSDVSVNGNLSVSGVIIGAVSEVVITDISALDNKPYYITFVDGSGNKPLYINSFNTLAYKNQSVGIGTSSPSNLLDVSGSATIRQNINFGNTSPIVSRFNSNCYMNVMSSCGSPSVTDIYFRTTNSDLSGIVFDLSFNDWGSDNVNVMLDMNLAGKASGVNQGGAYLSGKQYVSNTSGGNLFDTFLLNGFSRKDCTCTLSSPSSYKLRILIQPNNSCSITTGTLRILNGTSQNNISDLFLYLQ